MIGTGEEHQQGHDLKSKRYKKSLTMHSRNLNPRRNNGSVRNQQRLDGGILEVPAPKEIKMQGTVKKKIFPGT